MKKSSLDRQWGSLQVPLTDFQRSIGQIGKDQAASLLSRLALIHQVAKAFVVEDLTKLDVSPLDVEVEEITDPPLYDLDVEGGVVTIQYSYEVS